MEQRSFDVLIIGGGPGGYACALSAARAGLRVALFERDRVGGVCLNAGCIPTKYLLDKAAMVERIRSLNEQGMLRDTGAFSLKRIQEGKAAAIEQLVRGVSLLLKTGGVTVVRGEATMREPNAVCCNGARYLGKHVVIATGSRPVRPPIPGAELCMDSTQLLALTKPPQRLLVIGGGVIGLELACVYHAFGSDVTILEMLPALLPKEEPISVELLTRMLKRGGLTIKTACRVESIERVGAQLMVRYTEADAACRAEADAVLLAIGRAPQLVGIDAGSLGLKLSEDGAVAVDSCMRTNLAGVYAVGDAAGGYQLAHAAYAEAETAVRDMLGQTPAQTNAPVPRCIYTHPCFAAVGVTREQAEAAGRTVRMGVCKLESNGMALAKGASGAVFVLCDAETTQTLGVAIVGEDAPELVAFAAAAVAQGYTTEQWARMIVAHPSLAEAVREAALDAFGRAVHKAGARREAQPT